MSKKYINETGLAYLWGKCVDLFAPKNALNSKADLVDGKIPSSQLPESSSGQDSFLVEADLNPTANFSVTNPTKDYEAIANALSQKKDVKLLLNVNLSEDYYMAIIGEVETFYPTYGVIEFGAIINISLDDNVGEQVYHLKITFLADGSINTEYKMLSKDEAVAYDSDMIVECELNDELEVVSIGQNYNTIANALSLNKNVRLLLKVMIDGAIALSAIGKVEVFSLPDNFVMFGATAVIATAYSEDIEQVHHFRITLSHDSDTDTDVIESDIRVLSGESNNDSGGQSAVSPTVEVTQIDDGHRITITDVNGTESFDVMNGKNGNNGTPATHRWDGTVLTITSASGTTSADLKGDAFVYEDFTDAQLEALKGKAFTYEDFTPEQLEALKAEMVTTVLNALPTAEGASF